MFVGQTCDGYLYVDRIGVIDVIGIRMKDSMCILKCCLGASSITPLDLLQD